MKKAILILLTAALSAVGYGQNYAGSSSKVNTYLRNIKRRNIIQLTDSILIRDSSLRLWVVPLTSAGGTMDTTAIQSIVLNTSNVLYATGNNFTVNNRTATGSLTLQPQGAGQVFRTTAAGTPTFGTLDSTHVPIVHSSNWYAKVNDLKYYPNSGGSLTGLITLDSAVAANAFTNSGNTYTSMRVPVNSGLLFSGVTDGNYEWYMFKNSGGNVDFVNSNHADASGNPSLVMRFNSGGIRNYQNGNTILGVTVGQAGGSLDASAAFTVVSTDHGSAPFPSMTALQWSAIASKMNSLGYYNTTQNAYYYNSGGRTTRIIDSLNANFGSLVTLDSAVTAFSTTPGLWAGMVVPDSVGIQFRSFNTTNGSINNYLLTDRGNAFALYATPAGNTGAATQIFSMNTSGVNYIGSAAFNSYYSQGLSVGSSTASVANGIFTVNSTTRASLPVPVMTDAQRKVVSGPVQGNMVYTSDAVNEAPYIYKSNITAWSPLIDSAKMASGLTGQLVLDSGLNAFTTTAGYWTGMTVPDSVGILFRSFNTTGNANDNFWMGNRNGSFSITASNKPDGTGTNIQTLLSIDPTGLIKYFNASTTTNSAFQQGLNVGNGSSNGANGIFAVTSTTRPSMPFPVMTDAQRKTIATPVQGNFTYVSDASNEGLYGYKTTGTGSPIWSPYIDSLKMNNGLTGLVTLDSAVTAYGSIAGYYSALAVPENNGIWFKSGLTANGAQFNMQNRGGSLKIVTSNSANTVSATLFSMDGGAYSYYGGSSTVNSGFSNGLNVGSTGGSAASGIFSVLSTTRGSTPSPVMTDAQRKGIGTLAQGMTSYVSDASNEAAYVYKTTSVGSPAWVPIIDSAKMASGLTGVVTLDSAVTAFSSSAGYYTAMNVRDSNGIVFSSPNTTGNITNNYWIGNRGSQLQFVGSTATNSNNAVLATLQPIGFNVYGVSTNNSFYGVGLNVGSQSNGITNGVFAVYSTTRGSTPIPVMTDAQRKAIGTLAQGMTSYVSDAVNEAAYVYKSNISAWSPIMDSARMANGTTSMAITSGGVIMGGGASNAGRVDIGTNSLTTPGLVIQTLASATGDQFQTRASNGSVLMSIGANGKVVLDSARDAWTTTAGLYNAMEVPDSSFVIFKSSVFPPSSQNNIGVGNQNSTLQFVSSSKTDGTGTYSNFASMSPFIGIRSYVNGNYFINQAIGVSTATPASSYFYVNGTAKGSMPFPSMTQTQWNAIASKATALGYYDATYNYFYYNNGTTTTKLVDSLSPAIGGQMSIEGIGGGSTTIVDGTAVLKLAPQHNRNGIGNYVGGIVFNHLLNYNGTSTNNGTGDQVWIGERITSTTGTEQGAFVIATKSGTGATGTGTDIPTEKMTVLPNGNVGINQINPQFLLDINGTTNHGGLVTLDSAQTSYAGSTSIFKAVQVPDSNAIVFGNPFQTLAQHAVYNSGGNLYFTRSIGNNPQFEMEFGQFGAVNIKNSVVLGDMFTSATSTSLLDIVSTTQGTRPFPLQNDAQFGAIASKADGLGYYSNIQHALYLNENGTTTRLMDSTNTMPLVTGNEFVAPIGNVTLVSNGTTNDLPTINKVYAVRFYLPYKLVVNKLSGFVTTAATGNVQMAIYNDSKTKLFESGNVSTASPGAVSATLGAPQTLQPGFYWCAYSFDNTTAKMTAYGNANNSFIFDLNQQGQSPNAAASGVMPTTLGTLAQNANNGILINLTNY